MAHWKKLSNILAGTPVFVNCDNIAFMTQAMSGTKIHFSGGSSEQDVVSVTVREKPEEVMMANIARMV